MRDKSFGNNPDLINMKRTRAAFTKLKQTSEFKEWKQVQYRIQGKKCAWCMLPISKQYRNVHVDHALPIYHGGTNKYDNLVLAHAKCNVKKWIRIDAVPQWIINNKVKYEAALIKEEQERLYEEVDFDRRLLHWLNSWV